MYAPRTTCSRCASQIRAAAAQVPAQAHPNRLRSPSQAAWFAASSADAPDAPRSLGMAQQKGPQRGMQKGSSPSPRRSSKTLKPFKQSAAPSADESAVALFNDVVKPDSRNQKKSALQSMDEWQIASKMKELAEKHTGSRLKLKLFQTSIWPHLKSMRGQMPRHLYLSATQLLGGIIDAAIEKGHVWDSVAVSEMYSNVGKLDLDVRNGLVLNLCHAIVHEKNTSGQRDALFNELLHLWQHISQLKRKSQDGQDRRFILPSTEEVLKDISWSQAPAESSQTPSMPPLTRALAAIFNQFRPEQSRELVPGLLATVAALSDPRLPKHQMQMRMAPLLNLAAAVLEQGQADAFYVTEIFSSRIRFPLARLADLQSYVGQQWPKAMNMLSEPDAGWRRGLTSPTRSETAASSSLGGFHRQLRAAYRSRNPGAVISIWHELKVRLEQQPALGKQLREESEFLDFWIFVWCAVRRPNKLQETLDLMQELQVQPTVKSYTAMMHGWKMCKDADRIEALWRKLIEARVDLDLVIWTERISGLIEAGKPQAGIQAMAEMMGAWKTAVAEGRPNRAVQPSIEVVNAAFTGLIRLDMNAANEVLAWAGREGIEPNIRTYNILLRESFRGHTSSDVQSLLRAMKDQAIEPDAATFTIILEEVLGSMESSSAAEQVAAVKHVFADIEAAGLRPNLETYGKMLYAVASLANGADEAVAAVQAHMRGNGFSATPHMITILIERALAHDPPNMSAIDALLREHQLTDVSRGDQTLWERVMSAYAVTGDTTRAMTVFDDLARAGRPVTSLPCLTDLLRALLGAGRAAEARAVVSVVLQHKIKGREEARDSRYWRHHFWFMAKEHGALNWDEVPVDLQTRLNR